MRELLGEKAGKEVNANENITHNSNVTNELQNIKE
jgi:hypothetical protein